MSGSVSDLPFSASASMGLSELFFKIHHSEAEDEGHFLNSDFAGSGIVWLLESIGSENFPVYQCL